MSKLYIDCNMGAAGDMLMASLYELLSDVDKEKFLEKMNSLGIPEVKVIAEKKMSNVGIAGTHMKVLVNGHEEGLHEHEHHHHSRGLKEITQLIKSFDLPEKVITDAIEVFSIISNAESIVHDKPMTDIHFHEVGTYDAVTDVIGNCLLMHMHGYPQIFASHIHVGSGTVKCAHGILPVPAPATALILRGVPIYGGEIQGELCTPTGAAILKYFVQHYGGMPEMTMDKIGYGIGTKVFECANCLRTILGN